MNLVPRNIVTSGSAGKTIQLLSGEVKALSHLFWLPVDFFKRWWGKKSGFYANEVVILLMSLGAIGQSKFFKGAHNLTGRLQAGYGQATGQVMDLTGRLQAGRSWNLQAGYGNVMGSLKGGLWAGNRQVMGRSWTLQAGCGQVMGRLQSRLCTLWAGYGWVICILRGGYRQVMDLTGRSQAVGNDNM